MTYADILRPHSKNYALLYDIVCITFASLFIGVSARIAFPLPFSPVPVTAQTMAVLSIGMCLGSRRGALSILLYLLQGTLGAPVFAGGTCGLARIAGPTGGYLLGFVAAAFLTGSLAEKGWDRKSGTAFLAMLLGNGLIYLFGIPWLAL